jgi:hypothetical protein
MHQRPRPARGRDVTSHVRTHLRAQGPGSNQPWAAVCALDDAAISALLDALPQGLRELALAENEITNAGAASIMAALPVTTLEKVDLRRSDLDFDGVALLRAEKPKNSLGKPVEIIV